MALILFIASYYYKHSKESVFTNFPVSKYIDEKPQKGINLFFFFSMNNCVPCLGAIETLNSLRGKYKILGVIPMKEFAYMKEVRLATNAEFDIIGNAAFSKYKPNYLPTLIGVNNRGDILFVIPGVPGESEYLKELIEEFVRRADSML